MFRRPDGAPYANRRREYGGQIKTAFAAACRRAEIGVHITPHDLRHTWASWWYAAHGDVLRLRDLGGWSTVKLVERYAHLVPEGMASEIMGFWGVQPRVVEEETKG